MLARILVAVVAAVPLVLLAGCTSDDADVPASTATAAAWFQVRPVLAESKAGSTDCATAPMSSQPDAPVRACAAAAARAYSLGAAVLTNQDRDSVGWTERKGRRVVELGVTPGSVARFSATKKELEQQKAPRDQLAVLVDGVVVSTAEIDYLAAADTSGVLRFTLADDTQADALTLRLAA